MHGIILPFSCRAGTREMLAKRCRKSPSSASIWIENDSLFMRPWKNEEVWPDSGWDWIMLWSHFLRADFWDLRPANFCDRRCQKINAVLISPFFIYNKFKIVSYLLTMSDGVNSDIFEVSQIRESRALCLILFPENSSEYLKRQASYKLFCSFPQLLNISRSNSEICHLFTL